MTNESKAPRRTRQVRQPSLLAQTLTEAKDVNVEEVIAAADAANKAVFTAPSIERPAMRPPMREEDPRLAAERRAAEILGNIGDLDQGTDDFVAPPAPDGWSYEWKMKSVMGQEQTSYQVQLAHTGWEPVPTSRHPEQMPVNSNNPIIERKGMVLMQRPKVITDKMRDIDKRRARDQVVVKQQQLNDAPQGQFERNHPQAKARISNSYEALPVPQD